MPQQYHKISHGVIPQLERLDRAEQRVREINRDSDLPFSFAITNTSPVTQPIPFVLITFLPSNRITARAGEIAGSLKTELPRQQSMRSI